MRFGYEVQEGVVLPPYLNAGERVRGGVGTMLQRTRRRTRLRRTPAESRVQWKGSGEGAN